MEEEVEKLTFHVISLGQCVEIDPAVRCLKGSNFPQRVLHVWELSSSSVNIHGSFSSLKCKNKNASFEALARMQKNPRREDPPLGDWRGSRRGLC